jgi:hypothetical protein
VKQMVLSIMLYWVSGIGVLQLKKCIMEGGDCE